MAELLVIMACYVAAALLVQWAARRRRRDPGMRVVVALGRHALQAEDVVRRLRRWSRWSGRPLRIAVLLDRSDEEAARIVERLARRDPDLVWLHGDRQPDGWRSGPDGAVTSGAATGPVWEAPCRETPADGAYWWEWNRDEKRREP